MQGTEAGSQVYLWNRNSSGGEIWMAQRTQDWNLFQMLNVLASEALYLYAFLDDSRLRERMRCGVSGSLLLRTLFPPPDWSEYMSAPCDLGSNPCDLDIFLRTSRKLELLSWRSSWGRSRSEDAEARSLCVWNAILGSLYLKTEHSLEY